MFISQTHKSKKHTFIAVSTFIIATISLHTHAMTPQPTRPPESTHTQAHTSKQSTALSPIKTNATMHTVLKAGYNTGKALGIGLFSYMAYEMIAALCTISADQMKNNTGFTKNQTIYLTLCSLVTTPALAESIYTSYHTTENKQTSENKNSTKEAIKAIYTMAKANGIIASTWILYALIAKPNDFSLLTKSLMGSVLASTIAALGESISDDCEQLENENNATATTENETQLHG